jgi:glyoxylase-like metal-dependent hydrolase (beta-lactamase superfamily II)
MLSVVQQRLGKEAPERLIVPDELQDSRVTIEGTELEIVEFGEGESKHIVAINIPVRRALLCADLIYNGAHAFLQERHLESWTKRLDELEALVREKDIETIYPGHGGAGGVELIEKTRAYLRDFENAIALGDPKRAEEYILAKYPDYHVKPFLTAFSIPAYFPSAASS